LRGIGIAKSKKLGDANKRGFCVFLLPRGGICLSTMSDKDKKNRETTNVKPAPVLNNEIALEEDTETGSIQISNNVIAMIVKKYALEIPGVIRLAPQGLVSDIADMLSKRNYDRNIDIELGETGEASITLTLVLEFGVQIVKVAQAIQDTIKKHVEELAGVKVKKINVIVKELEEKVEEPAEPEPVAEEPAEEAK
jgi:uncharacterized alkaline shock family protein YloU